MRRLTKFTLFQLRAGAYILGLYWLLIFAGTHLPKPPVIAADLSDKTKHFAAFFALTLLLCYVTTSSDLVRRFKRITAIALAYAAFDELTQMLVPNRTADIWDFAADAAGIGTAIAIYLVVRWFAYRYFPSFIRGKTDDDNGAEDNNASNDHSDSQTCGTAGTPKTQSV